MRPREGATSTGEGRSADEKSEGCPSASVVNGFDDSNAALETGGTDNLTLRRRHMSSQSRCCFTDELGGGGQPTCNETVGPNRGADAIYDISDPANPRFISYFKIPRTQTDTENCVAHNGNLIPNSQGRDVLIQPWYNGLIYGSEIQRGFDVFKLDGFSSKSPVTVNAQTQTRF